LKHPRVIALSLSATVVGLTVWSFALEPASLSTREYRLSIPDWRADHAGLRIAVLADLHVGSPFNGITKLKRIVTTTNALKPDLILIPGDLVIHEVIGGRFVAPEDSAAVLATLTAPLGVWAVLGNHDWWLDAKRVRTALESHGIPVLEDEAVPIEYDASRIWLVGISDFWEGASDVRKAMSEVTDDSPVLLFTHNPDVFPNLTDRFSLMIAGHTHGGQVFLPLLGRPIVPSAYGERFAIGHVQENGRHLFVSSGLGTSILPVRFRVPPEVSVLELHPR
jgi:predicted MPP superfamily phosphohydrolase